MIRKLHLKMIDVKENYFTKFFLKSLIILTFICSFVLVTNVVSNIKSEYYKCNERIEYLAKKFDHLNHEKISTLMPTKVSNTNENLVPTTSWPKTVQDLNIHLYNNNWLPDGIFGDNITGWPIDIVPNVVHYVLFQDHRISFAHMLSIFSVLRNQKPQLIYIHCDCHEIIPDDNWNRILKFINQTNQVKLMIRPIERPTEIYGIEIDPNLRNWHGSDITRYRTISEFGGIFLDNDIYVCQSLNEFRKFEFTLNWDENQFLGCQVLIGNKNARFLKFVLETYKLYDTSKWYYNAGELPTTAILYKYPHLIHRIKVKFGVDAPAVCPFFYKQYHHDWMQQFYTFHMVMRGNEISWKDWCLGPDKPKHMKFDDKIIKTLNNTFGEMARWALFGQKEIIYD